MQQERGILYIPDPLGGALLPAPAEHTKVTTLVFNENERYLSQAQQALWELRKKCSWICVSARGPAAAIALALAVQLPVDRLALSQFSVFSPEKLPRQLAKLKTYARSNLFLAASEIMLCEISRWEIYRLSRGLGRRDVCLLDGWSQEELTAPWAQLCEKNLLIPGKCV